MPLHTDDIVLSEQLYKNDSGILLKIPHEQQINILSFCSYLPVHMNENFELPISQFNNVFQDLLMSNCAIKPVNCILQSFSVRTG